MTAKKNINIKGTKDGLVFLFNDECQFEDIVSELKDKLETSHQGILTGPLMQVTVKTGFRKLMVEQEKVIRDIFKSKGNLFVKTIENKIDQLKDQSKGNVKIFSGIIRSGQIYKFESNILFLGDVNPGGTIISTDDIYILGSLKGIAHAGIEGEKSAVIAASFMEPLQLKIADTYFRPSNEDIKKSKYQQFAYIKNEQITFDKISKLLKLRKVFGTLS